ncbi:hypothetical protein EVAR_39831_1 [Eumeta japonica]|uniref:Uncharacterized protein n=1 Tax=Eumeta variegata TaxID=151549 RepID=A0A4C1XB89_EUMVA|nr:hypothetical protein EVAR_39831_1 [Eumeta japonica]
MGTASTAPLLYAVFLLVRRSRKTSDEYPSIRPRAFSAARGVKAIFGKVSLSLTVVTPLVAPVRVAAPHRSRIWPFSRCRFDAAGDKNKVEGPAEPIRNVATEQLTH